jgi:hypothetical protein
MLSDIRCATMRATMSVVPPAGKGTIIRIGLDGYACACAAAAANTDTMENATAAVVFRPLANNCTFCLL